MVASNLVEFANTVNSTSQRLFGQLGGNDGSRFVPEGAIDCPLAWPQRCSHSRVETLDMRDLQALGTLIAAVARDF